MTEHVDTVKVHREGKLQYIQHVLQYGGSTRIHYSRGLIKSIASGLVTRLVAAKSLLCLFWAMYSVVAGKLLTATSCWLVMMLFCCAVVSLMLSTSRPTSSRLTPLPSRSSKVDVENGGSLFYIACDSICDMVCGAVVCCSYCADRSPRVLSDCWASSTFALGFFVHLLDGAKRCCC